MAATVTFLMTGLWLLSSNAKWNASSRTMALGPTEPLTEMSTRNIPGSKGQQAHKTDISQPQRLKTLLASMTSYRDSIIFIGMYFIYLFTLVSVID
jgi:hypothetical protein